MYRLEAIINEKEHFEKYAALLSNVFKNSSLYTPQYITWQYGQNPEGGAVGFDAWFDDELAGHYATIPVSALYNGRKVRGLLSLNTATHPNHQGKGLFTKLANHTYELAQANGYEFVIGVANANSTPGFVKKLNFTLVTPLQTLVGLGKVSTPRNQSNFRIDRSSAFLDWRLARPGGSYKLRAQQEACAIYAPTHLPFVMAQITNYESGNYKQHGLKKLGLLHATLWIGCNTSVKKSGIFTPIPDRFKSSPLNLILKSLNDSFVIPEASQIDFALIDFDAY
jgi:GNAT superfamily N-acetyltransferase